jgi:hypothetical protein
MKKRVLIVSLQAILLVFCSYIFFFVLGAPTKPGSGYLDEIESWGYKLEANATELIRREFANLKQILTAEEIDEAKYAEVIARLFIADLYTLTNKINKYDVSAAQFVWPDGVDNFKLNVHDTLYRFLEDNTNRRRTQALPEVSQFESVESEEITFEIDDEEFLGFKVTLSWSFVVDMGYDTSGEVILVKEGKHFFVVEFNPTLE